MRRQCVQMSRRNGLLPATGRRRRSRNFAFWPRADAPSGCVRVRFRGQSGHGHRQTARQLMTQSGHRIGTATVWSVPATTPVPSDACDNHNRNQHYSNRRHDASICETPHVRHSKVYRSGNSSNRDVLRMSSHLLSAVWTIRRRGRGTRHFLITHGFHRETASALRGFETHDALEGAQESGLAFWP